LFSIRDFSRSVFALPETVFSKGVNCMKEDQQRFLSVLGRLPLRLTTEQVAWVLNCQPRDVPILFASRLLKPLGNPPQNGIKLVSADELLGLAQDRAWLAKVTNAVHEYWRKKNARRNLVEGGGQ
jgi:hypothetical protein